MQVHWLECSEHQRLVAETLTANPEIACLTPRLRQDIQSLLCECLNTLESFAKLPAFLLSSYVMVQSLKESRC